MCERLTNQRHKPGHKMQSPSHAGKIQQREEDIRENVDFYPLVAGEVFAQRFPHRSELHHFLSHCSAGRRSPSAAMTRGPSC